MLVPKVFRLYKSLFVEEACRHWEPNPDRYRGDVSKGGRVNPAKLSELCGGSSHLPAYVCNPIQRPSAQLSDGRESCPLAFGKLHPSSLGSLWI